MIRKVAFWLFIVVLPADAALPAAVETFGTSANAGVWRVYDYADGFAYFPEWDNSVAGDEFIWLRHRGDEPLEFTADSAVGNGALTGSYASANVKEISCEIFIDQLADFDSLDCAILTRGADGVERWHYSLPFQRQDFSGNGWWTVRFGMKSAWTYFNGNSYVTMIPDPNFLSSVKEVSITFFPRPGSTINRKAAIDHFTLEPEVIAPQMIPSTTHQFHITFTPAPGLSADLQMLSSTAPYQWTPVPGQSYITGPNPHRFTTPMDLRVKIYRAMIFPDYHPIPPP